MLIIDPVRKYEIKGEVCQLLSKPFAAIVGNNQLVIAAVTGKRIRLMGWFAQSASAVANAAYGFKSASGGTLITSYMNLPLNTFTMDQIPIVDSGYCETNTGEGLYMDVATAAANFTVFYIIYTP